MTRYFAIPIKNLKHLNNLRSMILNHNRFDDFFLHQLGIEPYEIENYLAEYFVYEYHSGLGWRYELKSMPLIRVSTVYKIWYAKSYKDVFSRYASSIKKHRDDFFVGEAIDIWGYGLVDSYSKWGEFARVIGIRL